MSDEIFRINGYDYFTPDAKNYKAFVYQKCRVCDEPFDVSPPRNAATSMIEAMAHMEHMHVEFTCKHSGQVWHDQAYRLLKEMEATASQKLLELLDQERREIVANKTPTRVDFKRPSRWNF